MHDPSKSGLQYNIWQAIADHTQTVWQAIAKDAGHLVVAKMHDQQTEM